MAKPTSESIDPARAADLALAVIAADRFPYLATMDGDQPRVRPISPVRTDRFTAGASLYQVLWQVRPKRRRKADAAR